MASRERASRFHKARRHSARAIPVEAALLLLLGGGVWLVERVYPFDRTLRLLLLGLPLLALAGDLVNYLWCTLKLRAMRDT